MRFIKIIFPAAILVIILAFVVSPHPPTTTSDLIKQYAKNNTEHWDANAGLILPYHATWTTSSNAVDCRKIYDENPQSFWQSAAPFPNAFVTRKDLNVFLNKGSQIAASPEVKSFIALTDGDLNTSIKINSSKGKYWLSIHFKEPMAIQYLALKCGNNTAIQIETQGARRTELSHEQQQKLIYLKDDSYQFKRYELSGTYQNIRFTSTSPFEIFEMAALADYPQEYAIADLGKVKPVGTIYTRHFAGQNNAIDTKIYLSNDQKNWREIATINPKIEHTYITHLKEDVPARYVKIAHRLRPTDWNKVYLWEAGIYDKHGHYGAMPPAKKSRVTVAELLGVNSTWGWGHNKYSNLIPTNEGADLYRPLSSHARNYHDLAWDVKTPSNSPNYKLMAMGKGTEVQWWLNWDQEYKAWQKTGMKNQATIQIANFSDSDWNDPYQNAYDIGYNFARHFGPSHGNGLVTTLEVGNEPWKYEAKIYQQILLGMAQGAKKADPNIQVFPCALQAADPAMEKTDVFKNYMGLRLPAKAAKSLDGINIHCYSYLQNEAGKRIAVHPEHPNTSYREILSNVRFRDHNMPNKKIFLSEWGWDHNGAGEDCTHSECVSEQAAAAYAVRGALMAMRLGVDRASWFFFANEERPSSLYTRSGLTGSVQTGFKKKKSYYALVNLVKQLGDTYFLKTIQEDEKAWVYLFGNSKGKATHLVGWLPVTGDSKEVKQFVWKDKTLQLRALPIIVALD